MAKKDPHDAEPTATSGAAVAAEAEDEQDDNKEEQKPEKRFPDAERCGEQSDERP